VIVADASATNLPGATTETPPGPTPFALIGTTSFTPAAGKVYQLQAEVVGNPVPKPGENCRPGVQVYVNGAPTTFIEIDGYTAPVGFDSRFPEGSYATNLLTESGPQQITTKVFGDPDCAAGTALEKFRVVVLEFG
jgi:hypothetical protein